MKKALSLVVAMFVLLTMLASCSSQTSQTNSESTTGTEATTVGTTAAPSGEITLWWWTEQPEIIEGFNLSYPDIEVETVLVDAGDYMTKIQSTLASGGELPDILFGEISFRGKLFEMDILEDLNQAPYNFDKTQVFDYLIPTMSNDAGAVLGIETTQTPAGLAYRRDLALEYLGTDDRTELEAMFTDWDAFIAKGQDVSAQSNNEVFMMPSLGDVYYVINGQSRTPRISGDTLDTDAVTAVISDIAKFRDAGIIDKIVQWTPAWFASYGTGESIFYPIACWGIDNFVKPNDPEGEGNWGLMLPPNGGFSWGGTTMSITKTSENKELAWKFIEWYNLSEEGTEVKKVQGIIPVSIEEAADPYFSDSVDAFFGDENIGDLWMNQVIPTIYTNPLSKYDLPDIIAFEMVLSSMNADYSITVEQAVAMYKDEVLNGAPELIIE